MLFSGFDIKISDEHLLLGLYNNLFCFSSVKEESSLTCFCFLSEQKENDQRCRNWLLSTIERIRHKVVEMCCLRICD